jgi:hypothetical protein
MPPPSEYHRVAKEGLPRRWPREVAELLNNMAPDDRTLF